MWQLPSFRQTITNIFWKKENPSYVVSKIVDEELGLKKGKKVRFKRVEKFVDFFVEDTVPQLLYTLYRYCNEIKELKECEVEDDELHQKVVIVNHAVQELKSKVLEIDSLQPCIDNRDKDDFEVRIHPAKTKISDAIEHFLEVNFEITVASSRRTSAINRAVQARDLISYLPKKEHENVKPVVGGVHNPDPEESKDLPELPPSTSKVKHADQDHDESINLLASDLVNLHSLMNILHPPEEQDADSPPPESAPDARNGVKSSTIIKAAMFPIVGAVVGGVVGGPLGFMAGAKIGSVTGGCAVAGVTGTVIGYQGGKVMKNKRQQEEQAGTSTQEQS